MMVVMAVARRARPGHRAHPGHVMAGKEELRSRLRSIADATYAGHAPGFKLKVARTDLEEVVLELDQYFEGDLIAVEAEPDPAPGDDPVPAEDLAATDPAPSQPARNPGRRGGR